MLAKLIHAALPDFSENIHHTSYNFHNFSYIIHRFILMLSMQGKKFSRQHFEISFLLYPQQTMFVGFVRGCVYHFHNVCLSVTH